MPATQMRKEPLALCYEHHLEMKLNPSLAGNGRGIAETPTYACTEPDCSVHYNILRGYFVPDHSQKESTDELDTAPNVRCLQDGTPMYLGELNPEKRSFRLWICPHCDGRRTNEQGLIGLERDEMRKGLDESCAQS